MFNLAQHKASSELNPLVRELPLLGIGLSHPEHITLILGDETLEVPTVADCLENIEKAIGELKKRLWQTWQQLANTAKELLVQPGRNAGGLDNTLFIYNIKKSYALAGNFTQLKSIQDSIRDLLYLDVAKADEGLIRKYNALFYRSRILHKLIMREIYRTKVLKRWGRTEHKATLKLELIKISQSLSGPWANVDLSDEERQWKWDDSEQEFFDNRETAKKRQTRYNPEYYQDDDGVLFKFIDRNRDPYLWEGMDSDSPYPSRNYLQIP